jgi:hypothetical protein
MTVVAGCEHGTQLRMMLFNGKLCYEIQVKISKPTSSRVIGGIKKKKSTYKFLLYFSEFKCTSHQLIPVADLG